MVAFDGRGKHQMMQITDEYQEYAQHVQKRSEYRSLLRVDRIEQLRVGQAGMKTDDDARRMKRRHQHAGHGAEEQPHCQLCADQGGRLD